MVLAIALEEDGGRDLQRIFGAVERGHKLTVWPSDGAEVEPIALAEIADRAERFRRPTRVQLLSDGEHLSASCRDDDWIGAVLFTMAGHSETGRRLRLNFLAPDERNDWTALVVASRQQHE